MNSITIVGNLTKDPIEKDGQYGKLCFFTVAVNRKGNKPSDFFNVRVGGKQAEACGKYLSKGRSVGVKGSVHMETYGESKRSVLSLDAEEVEFLGAKADGGAEKHTPEPEADKGYTEVEDDELPFF